MKHTKFAPQLPSPATIHVLHGGSETLLPAEVVHCSGNVMKLVAGESIPAGTAVRIDVSGGMVLGEIARHAAGDSRIALYVEMDQVIPSVSDLAKLVMAVMDQRPAVRPSMDAPPSSPVEEGMLVPVSRRASR